MPPPPAPPPPAPAVDGDGDGILDAADRCPDSPEDKDGYQDDDGCDEPDNDADGIPDFIDACTLQPETINGVKDDDGCPDKGDPAVLLAGDRIELLVPLRFDRAALRGDARGVLAQVAATLRAHPEIVRLAIAAHVARSGNPAADVQLSSRRGAAVKKLLVELGVLAARLEVREVGSSQPLGGKRLDERVELVIAR